MRTVTPANPDVSATITSRHDRLTAVLWSAAVILVAVAAGLRPGAVLPAARATLEPFATLALIIAVSALAGRAGLFRVLASLLIPGRAPRSAAAAAVLVFTTLVSGLVNLDVAVVVAMPVALRAARRNRICAGRMALAVAVTANAASFLLPTANITTLLLLSHVRVAPAAYLRGSWLAWLLVAVVTIAPLAAWLATARDGPAGTCGQAGPGPSAAGPSARAALDLLPMFAAASAIRALLTAGIALRGSLTAQLLAGSALASAVNNLPAAAALRPAGATGLWAAVLATAIGPGLLVTGSVATLICRRIARDAGATLRGWQFTIIAAMLVPAQLAVAVAGLHLTGALS